MWLILLAIASYTLMVVALSRGPLSADSTLVVTLINLCGALIPLVFAGGSLWRGGLSGLALPGLAWGLAGGVGIAVFMLVMGRLAAKGWPAALVSPLVYGGAIVAVPVLGALLWSERLGPLQWAGLALIAAGALAVALGRAG
ncbi:hypothetical protein ACQ5SO_20640 [Rhodovulum sp. DZ06]|uniref:hypothetical protein n=1 Tax=Rhodovulum sp. DZ06 TaxID=3425126 RepID=UPI003D33F452